MPKPWGIFYPLIKDTMALNKVSNVRVKKEGGSMFKKGLQVAEAAAAAYHIGRTVFEVGKFAAPYILAAAV